MTLSARNVFDMSIMNMLNNTDIILPFFINNPKYGCKYTKKRGIMSTFANKFVKWKIEIHADNTRFR